MADPSTPLDDAELRRPQADGSILFCGARLRARVAVLKPGIVLVTARGEAGSEADARAESALLAELDRELERAGSLCVFADLRGSARMPAPSREKIAQWTRRHQARLVLSHVLIESKLLEMAMSIIAMLVGGGVFKTHSDPRTFLALVRKAAPKLAALPEIPA